LRRQEILVSRVSNSRYAKIVLIIRSSGESQPSISFGDRILEFKNLGFGGLRDKTLDYGFVKSQNPIAQSVKGEFLKVTCGCRFPKREIQEPSVESSLDRWKKKDPVCMDFQPAGWEGCIIKVHYLGEDIL
jgi:hypothetical protein